MYGVTVVMPECVLVKALCDKNKRSYKAAKSAYSL